MAEIKFDEKIFAGLKGKVALITGGSSGIGLATARFFSQQGAQIVSADVNPPPEDIPNVKFRKTDLTKWDEHYDLFEWTVKTHGRIDIAFLNAGVAEIEDVFVDRLDDNGRLQEPKYSVLAVNLFGPINGFKLAVHFMKKQSEGGSIVITGSGKSFNGVGGTPMYAAAKHGLLGMVRTLRTDIPEKYNIRLNLVCPFWTDTGIIPPEERAKIVSARECMQPADVPAKAVAYLSLNRECHGMVLYAACGKYFDVEYGFHLTRPVWLGAKNHLDRVSWEEDPAALAFKTKFE
ncbi:uncharacterized protein Z520_07761 [Fonsecaea multimorphosa CBS 102226]|uniref:Uncharacterized protein n=1 Tax=Fonsecaea multimorphosa CBS 102226 TaxID=1442371 RepID=A0A0D2H3T1_9EURO|nr:uncharacterized protein Z520_07761 [Fonsecaea multimorphosa CBS 102226]KIX96495.1 hypothetical protein Z520_07761 [Fonsecaea multimorphosa CBS 102226]OAL28304.1 hypothetical protein AYO22_03010 [Fonsecaea multimorphosa]